MSNSPLVEHTNLSPNYNPRNHKIDTITIHHMAGVLSAEACGYIFEKESRQASSNYGIGYDGKIAMYVEEKNRSWCSGSSSNDHRAITIEVSNSNMGEPWLVSDYVLSRLIDLCVDICKRNNIPKLNYTGDTSGNLTMHKWFQNTSCPGTYLSSKFPYIASEVNKRLNANVPSEEATTNNYKLGDIVEINGVYISSEATNKLVPLITKGTITRIIPNARNPYLLNDGEIGWINENCIIKPLNNKIYKTIVNCYWLNLRTEASYGNNVYKVVQAGTRVEYLEDVNGWSKIRYNDKILYCGSSYLR